MARQPDFARDGIRFLDESPEPVKATPAAGTTPPAGARGGHAATSREKKTKKERPVGLIAFLAVVAGGLIWKAAHQEPIAVGEVFEERFEVLMEEPRIEVEAIQGAVRIHRGSGRQVVCKVEVTGKGDSPAEAGRALGALRPVLRSHGDGVSVRVGGLELREPIDAEVSIRLEVPERSQVRVVTGLGSVRVKDVRGAVAARSGMGKIEVKGASGPLVLDTKNGSIEVKADDALMLATTSNGSIRFEGSLARGNSRLVAGNGSVTMKLPEHAELAVDALAGNGRITSDFPIVPERVRAGVIPVGYEPQDGDETRVEIRTGNGSIRVEKD